MGRRSLNILPVSGFGLEVQEVLPTPPDHAEGRRNLAQFRAATALVPTGGRLVLSLHSTEGSPGASTTALYLAAHWASTGTEVLLIEADPGGGSLSHNLGIQVMPGAASLVASGLPVSAESLVDHSQDVLFSNLHVMPSTSSPNKAQEIVRWMDERAEEFSAVSAKGLSIILDMGRVGLNGAGEGLRAHSSGVVVVARGDTSPSSVEDIGKLFSLTPLPPEMDRGVVTIGESPMSTEDWREKCGVTFCGSIRLSADVTGDLTAFLNRKKRKSKAWRLDLEAVAESLLPYTKAPESAARRVRDAEAVAERPAVAESAGAGDTPQDVAPGSETGIGVYAPVPSSGHQVPPSGLFGQPEAPPPFVPQAMGANQDPPESPQPAFELPPPLPEHGQAEPPPSHAGFPPPPHYQSAPPAAPPVAPPPYHGAPPVSPHYQSAPPAAPPVAPPPYHGAPPVAPHYQSAPPAAPPVAPPPYHGAPPVAPAAPPQAAPPPYGSPPAAPHVPPPYDSPPAATPGVTQPPADFAPPVMPAAGQETEPPADVRPSGSFRDWAARLHDEQAQGSSGSGRSGTS